MSFSCLTLRWFVSKLYHFMMCIDGGLFGFILIGTLWASWTFITFSFARLGKFLPLALQIGGSLSLAYTHLFLVLLWCWCCYTSCCSKGPLDFLQLSRFSFSFSLLADTVILSSNLLIWTSALSKLLLIFFKGILRFRYYNLHFWLVLTYCFCIFFNAYSLFIFSVRSLILLLRSLRILITIIWNSAYGIYVAFILSISFNSFCGFCFSFAGDVFQNICF